LLLALLSVSCAPPVAIEVPTAAAPTSIPAATPTLHAPEIRFAIIGAVLSKNVWALFDARGYSYNDYAIRSDYWPRLYHLTVPDGHFEPLAARGMPSEVQAEGALFAATVPLRSDLKWTDGSPFTADDVAFTINTALSFQLGFDWHAYYDPAWLDHAEALDAHTVKFYFKRAPDVAVWQYGALQGPIVQYLYWLPKLPDAVALLPKAESLSQINGLDAKVTDLQKRVDALVATGAASTGEQARQLQVELQRQQGDLDQARNDLSKAEVGVNTAMQAARQALYSLGAQDEPTLGTWMPAGYANGTWINGANPSHPFGSPHFDRATYTVYEEEASALTALQGGEIHTILEPHGLSSAAVHGSIPVAHVVSNEDSAAHFIVINPSRSPLADPALRLALFCSVDRGQLARDLLVAPFASFVPGNGAWEDPMPTGPCRDGYDSLKRFDRTKAVSILKAAGYTWSMEPADGQAGTGLTRPDGQPFLPLVLLAPSEEADPQTAKAAHFVELSARYLGIPVTIRFSDTVDIRFAVFNDRDYDMAILGWRLSAYPSYLCDWFGAANAFGYSNPQISADCGALSATSNLGSARKLIFDIQSALAQDPPFIPLYSELTYDDYRGITYPFDQVLNGLSGSYGAPSLAVPASP
jgi:ABC-type transport system substrate-binding protein